MKSIANQYRDLKEGKMSQFNFMRNLRMSMPQYITNTTSFKDAVRILKNKAILTESEANIKLKFEGKLGKSDMLITLDYNDKKKSKIEDKQYPVGLDKSGDYEIDIIEQGFEYNDTMKIVQNLIDKDKSKWDKIELKVINGENVYQDKFNMSNWKGINYWIRENLNEAIYFQSPGGVDYPGRERQPKYDMDSFDRELDRELEYYENEYPGLVAFVNKLGNDDETNPKFQEIIDKYDDPAGAADEFITLFKKQTTDDGELDDMISRGEDELSPDMYKFQDSPDAISEATPDEEEITILGSDKAIRMLKSELKNNKVEFKTDGNKVNVKNSPKVRMAVKMVKERVGMQSIKLSENTKPLNEAKKKKAKKEEKPYNPNAIHPSELRMGIRVEMEHTDDPKKAEKIALDHLAENPFYYTALKLSGIESPSAPKAKSVAPKKIKKKDATELVDKDNQMVKVKLKEVLEKLIRAELRNY